jgi:exodeoxyribonuclease-3
MKITSWNVNSIRARLPRVLEWVDAAQPDVLCLQEIKCVAEQFPAEALAERGYTLAIHGQPTYNGVAIAARRPLEDVRVTTLRADAPQARIISAVVEGVRVVNLYAPNGKAVGSEPYAYKLSWLDELREWLDRDFRPDEPLLLCGDFNIAPEDRDVHKPAEWRERVLCSTPERERFARLLDWGLRDAFRHFTADGGHYTWWDYRALSFRRNNGLRIDHHLVTPGLLARAESVAIDRPERGREKASDHVPVTLSLADSAS